MAKNTKKNALENGLTEQQELFCQLYCQGTMSNKECYLTAYEGSNEKSAESNSSRLLKNPKIVARINEILNEMAEDCEISDKSIIRELKRLAFGSKNDMARLKALSMLGQITGLFGKEEKTTTNNIIHITVEDNDKPRLEDNGNGKVVSTSFVVVDNNDSE